MSYPPPPGSHEGGYGAPGSPQGGYGAPSQPRNGLGVAALVLGIIAILLSWTVFGGILLGIAAVVLGVMGRGRAKKGQATNGGVALWGVITGAVAILLSILMIALGAWLLNQLGFGDLQACLDQAGNDQAAIQQCQVEYNEQIQEQFGESG